MDYYEITKAIRMKLEYVPAAAGQKDKDNIQFSSDVFNSDFEDMVCGYVDAINEVKKVKNRNKRAILIFIAMGFNQDEIAEMLHRNKSSISRALCWLRKYFDKECNE